MKNKIFIIGLIAVVVIGIYFAVKKPANAPVKDQSESASSEKDINNTEKMSAEEMGKMDQASSIENISKTIVNYTDSGFSPSSVEIKIGQTVQFVNKSNSGMWVASAPHPPHTAYPEFDAKQNIPMGKTYEFTFTKIGEWHYHNHLKASAIGTVVVK